MLRTLNADEIGMVAGGDMEIYLGDEVFAGENLATTTSVTVTDLGDSYVVELELDDYAAYSSNDRGGDLAMSSSAPSSGNLSPMQQQGGRRTVSTTISKGSTTTTRASGTISGNLSVFGRGVRVTGNFSYSQTNTSRSTTTTTTTSDNPDTPRRRPGYN